MIFQKGVLPIAVTRIIPMHISKGKTALQSLSARLDYATNPSKTKNGKLVTAYALGDAYSYDALSAVLAGSQKHRPKTKPIQQNELISTAIDAQRMEAKGKGCTYWAKNFNSKQYAKSILFLTENQLSIDDLPRAVEEACAKADALTAELKKVEAQIASTSQLIDQVRVYLAAVSTYGKMVEV